MATPNSFMNATLNNMPAQNVLIPSSNPFLAKASQMPWADILETNDENNSNIIDTTEWGNNFISKGEALKIFNENGLKVGVIFKVESEKK